MVEHTPTPWKFDEVQTSCGRCFRIGSEAQLSEQRDNRGNCKLPSYACLYDDYGQGENATKANAALIVRAVNSHDALVKALVPFALMADLLETHNRGYADSETWPVFIKELRTARAALSFACSEEA